MNDKRYLTNDIEGYNFGYQYQERQHCSQVFKNRFMSNIIAEEVIKSRYSGRISDLDLDMIQFVFDHSFATIDILRDLFLPEMSLEDAAGKVENLVKSRYLNKFMLVQTGFEQTITTFPEDALVIYCLDYAGKVLLMNYGEDEEDNIAKWNSTAVMMSGPRISSKLSTARLYASLKKTCRGNLVYMKSGARCGNRKKYLTPSFEFAIESKGGRKYFIGLTAKEITLLPNFRDFVAKVDDFYAGVGDWSTIFHDGGSAAPVIIVLADTDKTAFEAARIVASNSNLSSVRYTTDARICRDLSQSGAFLKFVPEGKSEEHPSAHMEEVRASIFAPPAEETTEV